MPTMDVTLEQGALSEEAKSTLVGQLSAMLGEFEHAPSGGRPVTWCFLDERPRVAGMASERPVYRIVLSVSGAESRQRLVERVTELVLSAEGTPVTPLEADRVHVEVRDDRAGFLDACAELLP
jgi:phenylpyruvate tautomerase PptA (4-oxalocrotonate tautomerase family)